MTSTDTDSTTEPFRLDARDNRMLYDASRMPRYTGFAALYGHSHGLISYEDDMPATPAEDADWPLYLASVHRMLVDKGVMAAYGQHLVETACAADCPWWCTEAHAMIASDDAIMHNRVLASVTFDSADTVNRGKKIDIDLTAFTGPAGDKYATVPSVHMDVPEELSVGDAADLATALRAAVDAVRTIEQADRDAAGGTVR